MCTYAYMYIRIHTHMYVYAHMHVCKHVCESARKYVQASMCAFVVHI